MVRDSYSIAELTALHLPGYPRSRQGWYGLVERDKWAFLEVEARGGKRGIKRLYQPPPEVKALIDAGGIGSALAATIRQIEVKSGGAFINAVLLASLLDAVDAVAARKFDKPLPTTVRLTAALNAYRSIGECWATDPLDLVACSTLGPTEYEGAASMALSGHRVAEDGSSSDLVISTISIGDGRPLKAGK